MILFPINILKQKTVLGIHTPGTVFSYIVSFQSTLKFIASFFVRIFLFVLMNQSFGIGLQQQLQFLYLAFQR